MDARKFRKILQKYEEGSCSEEERRWVDNWLNQLAAQGDGTIQNPMEAKEKFFKNIEEITRRDKLAAEKQTVFRKWAIAGSIAAMLIVGVGVFQYYFTNDKQFSYLNNFTGQEVATEVINNTQVPKTTRLPDGSEVTLYPQSKLTQVSYTEGERRMSLEGHAFFKVAPNPNRPFIIVTDKLITKVLGTSFTINAQKGEVESVEVKTGKVAVYKSSNSDLKNLPGSFVAITPNHKVYFDEVNEKLVTSIVNHPVVIPAIAQGVSETGGKADNSIQPKNYEMRFEETSVVKILKALEAAYGVKIRWESHKAPDCIITANLKDEDLFMRLQVVCELIGGSYQVDGETIIVSSRGCK